MPAPTVAMGLPEADAKMVVATSHDDCQKLKDLLQKKDPTTMLLVMASSKPEASPNSSRASMHPLLAAAACRGDLKELRYLLNWQGPEQKPTENLSQGRLAWISHCFTKNRSSIPDVSQEFLNQVTAYSCGNCTNSTGPSVDVEQGGTDSYAVPLSLNGVTVEGDTVLHLLAANGEEQNFLDCANFIIGDLMEVGLLSKKNNNGDTPLHCAARAGRTKMVSCLIILALPREDRILLKQPLREENTKRTLEQVLRKDNNRSTVEQLLREVNNRMETVLHEAVRIGDNQSVIELLTADRKLACFPGIGTSPLYLAISLGRAKTAKTLHDESEGKILSYSGPDGQNALHAAVLRGAELTEMVLKWNTNKGLTTAMEDKNGSTPLHFAAGLKAKETLAQVLKANTAAMYQPDNNGLYPIHVAASVGAEKAIDLIVQCGNTSAGLRDAKGRTFLHVAIGERKVPVVSYACGNRSVAWILNMQDNDGYTALHLAVQAGSLRMFSALLANRLVDLNLANARGETPLDIACYKIPPGLFYDQNSEAKIKWTLELIHAMRGTYHWGHFKEKYEQIHGRQIEYEKKHMENLKDSSQALCVGSVLIATVTFGAAFALPGGYIADDHPYRGTPTLAGTYAFNAFVMTNTLAFTLSSAATVLLIRSGTPYVSLRSRTFYSSLAFQIVNISVTCLIAAFALAVYVVLGSVARYTAIVACALSFLVVLCNYADPWLKWAILLRPLIVRCGALPTLLMYQLLLAVMAFVTFLPFLVVFISAWFEPVKLVR